MNDLHKRFGATVRSLREAQGWSLEVLAEKADLSRSFAGDIERGVAMPSLATVVKLAAGLGMTATALLEQSEDWRL